MVKKSQKTALFIGETQITDYVFDEVIDESEDIIILSSGESICWYNKNTGTKIAEVNNVLAYEWCRYGIVVKKKSGYKLYSLDGKILLRQLYDRIEENGNYFELYKNGKKGLYDGNNRKIILNPEFDAIDIEPDYFIVNDNKKKGIYSKNGERIISVIYENIDMFYGNDNIFFITTTEEGKRAVYSLEGKIKIIVPLDHYYGISVMPEHYIIASSNGHSLYSHSGELLYNSAIYSERINQKVLVIGDFASKSAYSLLTGEKVIEDAQEIKVLYDMLLVIKNNKFGLYSNLGKEILACEYDYIIDTYLSGIVLARKQNQNYFYILTRNKLIRADLMKQNKITREILLFSDGKWRKISDFE